MKKQIIITCFLAFAYLAKAQWTTNANAGIYNTNTGNVGIGTSTPAEKLDVTGNIRFSGYLSPNGIAGSTGQFLTSGGSSAAPVWTSLGTTLSGGLAGYITKWSGTSALAGYSTLYDDGSTVSSNGNLLVSGKIGLSYTPGSLGDIGIMNLNTDASISVANTTGAESAVKVGNGLTSYKLYFDGSTNCGRIGNGAVDFLSFKQNNIAQVWVGHNQPQGANSDFSFGVGGKVVAQSLYIRGNSPVYWADYVFEPGYKLTPLQEVEAYYKVNGHLSEIPNAAEVAENGIDVAQINTLLVKKVEELTLYVVAQHKQMAEQRKRLENLTKTTRE